MTSLDAVPQGEEVLNPQPAPQPAPRSAPSGMAGAIDRRVGTPGTPGTPEVSLPNETPNPYGGDNRYDPPAPLEAGIGLENFGSVPGANQGLGGQILGSAGGGTGDPEIDELTMYLDSLFAPEQAGPPPADAGAGAVAGGTGLEGAVARRTGMKAPGTQEPSRHGFTTGFGEDLGDMIGTASQPVVDLFNNSWDLSGRVLRGLSGLGHGINRGVSGAIRQ